MGDGRHDARRFFVRRYIAAEFLVRETAATCCFFGSVILYRQGRRPRVKCGRADLRILERVRVKIMDLD